MMQCPQCGAETPEDEWNCVSCRINLYWAQQHYDELARLRKRQGLNPRASTPSFLRQSHRKEMEERMRRGLPPENNVRKLARRLMQGEDDKTP